LSSPGGNEEIDKARNLKKKKVENVLSVERFTKNWLITSAKPEFCIIPIIPA